MIESRPLPPDPSAESLATAAALKDEMGDTALDAAKAALVAAERMGSAKLIDLWAGVRVVLEGSSPA